MELGGGIFNSMAARNRDNIIQLGMLADKTSSGDIMLVVELKAVIR